MCSSALVHESKRQKATSLHKECVHCLVSEVLQPWFVVLNSWINQSKCDFRIKWCSSNPCKACKEWIMNQEVGQQGFGIPYFWHLHFSPAWFGAVQKRVLLGGHGVWAGYGTRVRQCLGPRLLYASGTELSSTAFGVWDIHNRISQKTLDVIEEVWW